MKADTEMPPSDAPERPVTRANKRRPPEDLRAVVRPDGRSRAAKAVKRLRADLIRHVGGRPSATQSALIDQIIQLRLRLIAMDAAFVERGEQSAHDSRMYLSWANAFSRLIRQLGVKGAASVAPSLSDYLASRAGGAKAGLP